MASVAGEVRPGAPGVRHAARAGTDPDPAAVRVRVVGRIRRPPMDSATTRTRSTPCSASTPPARPASPSSPASGSAPGATGRTAQNRDGSWAYNPGPAERRHRQHDLRGDLQPDHHRPRAVRSRASSSSATASSTAASGRSTPASRPGSTGWPATSTSAEHQRAAASGQFYYLYGLERAGRLSGLRFFGRHDWYREGAEELVRIQDHLTAPGGASDQEGDPLLATSFALLFLAKGRSPVLVNKLRHGPGPTGTTTTTTSRTSSAWSRATGSTCSPGRSSTPTHATVEDMLQAPIAYLNGHEAPRARAREAKQRSATSSSRAG